MHPYALRLDIFREIWYHNNRKFEYAARNEGSSVKIRRNRHYRESRNTRRCCRERTFPLEMLTLLGMKSAARIHSSKGELCTFAPLGTYQLLRFLLAACRSR